MWTVELKLDSGLSTSEYLTENLVVKQNVKGMMLGDFIVSVKKEDKYVEVSTLDELKRHMNGWLYLSVLIERRFLTEDFPTLETMRGVEKSEARLAQFEEELDVLDEITLGGKKRMLKERNEKLSMQIIAKDKVIDSLQMQLVNSLIENKEELQKDKVNLEKEKTKIEELSMKLVDQDKAIGVLMDELREGKNKLEENKRKLERALVDLKFLTLTSKIQERRERQRLQMLEEMRVQFRNRTPPKRK